MISTHFAEIRPVFVNGVVEYAGPPLGAKSGCARIFESVPDAANVAAGTAESTSQRPPTFLIAMSKETAPSGPPFFRWTRSTMSARVLVALSKVHPWKLVPISGNGVTGMKPRAQSVRPPPRRMAAVANDQARSECLRPIAAGTKTSSVRSIAARSAGDTLAFAPAVDAAQPASERATATTNTIRRTFRH